MRLATLIIGILVSGFYGFQAILGFLLGGYAVTILAAIFGLIASAFAIGVPVVSVVGFGLAAALLSFFVAPEYPDATVWTWAYLALGGMSLASAIKAGRKRRRPTATFEDRA